MYKNNLDSNILSVFNNIELLFSDKLKIGTIFLNLEKLAYYFYKQNIFYEIIYHNEILKLL